MLIATLLLVCGHSNGAYFWMLSRSAILLVMCLKSHSGYALRFCILVSSSCPASGFNNEKRRGNRAAQSSLGLKRCYDFESRF